MWIIGSGGMIACDKFMCVCVCVCVYMQCVGGDLNTATCTYRHISTYQRVSLWSEL